MCSCFDQFLYHIIWSETQKGLLNGQFDTLWINAYLVHFCNRKINSPSGIRVEPLTTFKTSLHNHLFFPRLIFFQFSLKVSLVQKPE